VSNREEKPIDLFHGTNFKAPHYGQQRSVLTIHDLWLARNPQYSKKLFGQALSSWKLSRLAKQMAKIIAVSKFSAQEIHEVLSVPLEQIAVIHHGCSVSLSVERNEAKFQELSRRWNLSARPYILFVGGAEPRKNHRSLFHAFSRSKILTDNFSLVAVGSLDSRGANLIQTAQTYDIGEAVSCPGLVNADDLQTLYAFATIFVFPSLYEGFGLPLLEAMASGVPVIASNRTAIPEIAGEAAIYVNPENPEDLMHALEHLVADQDAQTRLREKGLDRVKQFSWEKAAQETLSLYREVLS